MNGEELTTDDLIDVKSQRVVRPRPPTLTSIPSLLSVFQEEWDALALETYTLQQNLSQTRRELSAALYQHDAAVRVIARLTKERDEARDALSKVTVGATRAAADGEAMQVDSAALPQAVLELVENTQARYEISGVILADYHVKNTDNDALFKASRRLAASVRSPKAGLPLTPSRHTSPLRALSLSTLEAAPLQSTRLASWHSLAVLMGLWAFTLFPKRPSCRL